MQFGQLEWYVIDHLHLSWVIPRNAIASKKGEKRCGGIICSKCYFAYKQISEFHAQFDCWPTMSDLAGWPGWWDGWDR